MECKECGNSMTLILTSYKCDWCDGIVEKEWESGATTEPLPFLDLGLEIDFSYGWHGSQVYTMTAEDLDDWCSLGSPGEEPTSGSLDDWFDYYNLPCTD